MDVKDLRPESDPNNDGSKYSHGGVALQCIRNKSYQDIGSNSLAKAEPTPVRPCAVIGPDRVVPPHASSDVFQKRGLVEPWPISENLYRRPPEYPHKISNTHPSRNISPRQTFQENMQRIMVPPTYNAVRHSDDTNFNQIQDRNIAKNVKPNVASEAKYCDVPYAMNTLTSEPKNIRDSEMYVPSVNSPLTRTAPHIWPPASVNVHAPRAYGHELYQYPPYPNCPGQQPVVIPMTRPHRTISDDPAYVYPEHYYQDANARFKAYPPIKERFPQPRYEYIGNYPNQFHTAPPQQTHKYDVTKPGQSHPYPIYPHLKYVDNRVPEHAMEGYQRPINQQPHYNVQFRNQLFHPAFAPVPGSSSQNKLHPYPPDGSVKPVASNKMHYDNSSKIYIDYENARNKTFPTTDSYFINEMGRVQNVKNQLAMTNYSSIGMHSAPSQQYFRKDNSQIKPFEYMPHFRNFDPSLNAVMRHAPQFSPNTLAISPTDSSTSNDISQTHGISQEDCGYVSQSSTASVRSMDSGAYRLPHEYYKKYDFRYGSIVGSTPTLTKSDLNSNSENSKDKQQQINVRQFLQMWNEGDEDSENNKSKEIVIQTGSSDTRHFPKQHDTYQDQLYVLGLVNVPSEELGKYEHIQKISKLPENIKGYNNLELLSQFEEAIESSKAPGFKSIPKEYQIPSKDSLSKQLIGSLPRPVSPLDVEAKISQSVIHKEVGCNFEIRPCSPKMLNVELAAPALNVLGERTIEKVSNPLSKKIKSPNPFNPNDNSNSQTIKRQESSFAINENPSCKMVRSPFGANNMDSVKTNYSLQDLEINSGVCLASLPRLDNEIEFNFPEVNQQFINANKTDTNYAIRHYSRNDVEIESASSDITFNNKDLKKKESALLAEEPEKPFTKLSKYRKLKVHSTDRSEKNEIATVLRKDSVIIKNPENIKNIEDKLLENSFNVPINLSSQSSVCHVAPSKLESRDSDVDIALDFSLNKSGNDLPVIDFSQHISCENDELSDPCKTPDVNTTFHETIISNLKNTVAECMDTGVNEIKCVENTDAKIDIKANSNENTIKPQDMNKSAHTFSDNVVTDTDNTLPSDNLPVIHDAGHGNTSNEEECKDNIRVSAEEQNNECGTYNKAIKTNNNIAHEENPPKHLTYPDNLALSPQTEIAPKRHESGELMDFLSTENEENNSIHNQKVKSKQILSSQNKIDFENDEISATLEKIFQENTDDTSVPNSSITSSLVSVSMPVKIICCHKSKELYSPWIQKLLTNSEGLCSNRENAKVQNKTSKSFLMVNEYNTTDLNNKNELKKQQLQNMNGERNNEIEDGTVDEITTISTEPMSTHDSSKSETESFIKRCQLDANTDNAKDLNMPFSSKIETQELLKTLTDETDFSSDNRPNEFVTKDCKINPESDVDTRNCTEESVINMIQDTECGKERPNSDFVHTALLSVEDQPEIVHSTPPEEASETLDSRDSVCINNNTVNKVENYFNIAILNIEDKDNKIETTHYTTAEKSSETFDSNYSKNVNNVQNVFNIETLNENKYSNKIEVAHCTTSEESSETLDTNKNCKNVNNIENVLDVEIINVENKDNNKREIARCTTAAASSETLDINKNSKNVNEVENVFDLKILNVENNDNKTETVYCTTAGEAPVVLDSRDIVSKPVNVVENFNSNDFAKQQVENLIEKTTDTGMIMCKIGGDANLARESDIVQEGEKRNIGSLSQNVIMNKISITRETLDSLIDHKFDNLIEHETDENQTDNLDEIVMKGCDTVETSKTCDSSKADYVMNNTDQEDHVNSTVESSSHIVIDNFAYNQIGEYQCGESLCDHVEKSCDSGVGHASEILDSCSNDCECDSIAKDSNTPSFISITNSAPDYCTEHQLDELQRRETIDKIATKNHKHGADEMSNTFNGILVSNSNTVGLEDLSNLNDPSNSVSYSCANLKLEDDEIQKSDENSIGSKIVLIDNDTSSVSDTIKNDQVSDIQSQKVDSCPVLENVPNCISDKQVEHKKAEYETNIVTDDKGLLSLCNDDEKESMCYQVVENENIQSENYAFVSDIRDTPANRRRRLKRSFSDSALITYKNRDATDKQETENSVSIWPPKRQRVNEVESSEHQVIDENFSSFIQNTRRNSVCSFYNEENVSFCILIDDNCILTEENEEEKICFADISEVNITNEEDDINEIVCCSPVNQLDFSESVILDFENEKPIQETWLDDVACVETVVSDDILEDGVIRTRVSAEDVEVSEIYNCDITEETDVLNFISEETINDNISEIVETHKSHIGVDEMFNDEQPQVVQLCNDMYENKCLEKILSEPISPVHSQSPTLDYIKPALSTDDTTKKIISEGKENIFVAEMPLQSFENYPNHNSDDIENQIRVSEDTTNQTEASCSTQDYDVLHTFDSSINKVFSFNGQDKDIDNCTSSSSPEVSSTTSEDKSSCILLKITNYNGSRVSEVNEVNRNRPRCKFTEEKEYSNSHGVFPKRPLITKAAQKYIPPIKETIRDLKVKLTLPQQSLLKLKQLKLSRTVPKVNKQNNASLATPKKPKPNFEDVLKNIDKVQIKLHKEKSKKSKNIVPKVVIKKNVFGSHYTSSSNKNTFNPDLTGRKWQPWVFLEKNHFIDKMAKNNNTKAIYSHRKKSYVLADKFKKYKSVSNCSAKFVISHPKTGDSSKGQLKYTIRLKHTY